MNPSQTKHDVAVYIGRFQPFHNGHLALLRHALASAAQIVVVIGSAHQARTPKNPFSWQERAEMVRLALADGDAKRVQFLPVRDYFDQPRWVHAVRSGVEALVRRPDGAPPRSIALVGHFKDATSEYLSNFPDWALLTQDRLAVADGVHLRDSIFGCAGQALEPTLSALVAQTPATTRDFLRAWVALPYFEAMAEEWRVLKQYRESWKSAPYPPVLVTVDAIVRCSDRVLLIRRGEAPGKGLQAVPGGFIDPRETAFQSTLRELREETRLNLLDMTLRRCLKATAVFDHPDRSLRGRTITLAHYFDLGDHELPEVQAADDAASVAWVDIARLPAMEDQFHDDHFHMLDHFLGLTVA